MLRHGETLWNVEQRLQGHENSPLSERGIKQANGFVGFAKALKPQKVISSDLGRTVETAKIIGYENCDKDHRLRELQMGAWTGRVKDDLIENHSEEYIAWREGRYTPEGGEEWNNFKKRISGSLRQWVRESQGDILAVVHSGVIRAACCEFIDVSPSALMPVSPGAATIFRIYSSEDFKLEGYNVGAFIPDDNVAE